MKAQKCGCHLANEGDLAYLHFQNVRQCLPKCSVTSESTFSSKIVRHYTVTYLSENILYKVLPDKNTLSHRNSKQCIKKITDLMALAMHRNFYRCSKSKLKKDF